MIPWTWSDVPEFAREEYFRDVVADIGNDAIYINTGVDSSTQNALDEYFAMDRLCDRRERFLWLWRRALNEAYPVYADQMEMWKERKAYKWYYDNQKDNVKTHDGTFKLDENTKAELIKAINTKLDEIGKSVTDTDRTGNSQTTGETHGTSENTSTGHSTATGESHNENESTTTGNSTDTGKQRNFAFAYPESNYSGGVIPYDIDNNPSVEFISTQGDAISKTHNEHTDTTEGAEDGTTSSEENSTDTSNGKTSGTSAGSEENQENIDSTTDTTRNATGSTNEEDNSISTKGQETATHWEETTTYKGDSLTAIARELLEELPATDFFSKFVAKLKNCFQNDFIFDEIEEGL